MKDSKLIKSIIIENGSTHFELSTGFQFEEMTKKVARIAFGDEDHFINESIMLGLLYDDEIFTNLHVKINNLYFYENYSAEEIAETLGNNHAIETIKYMILKICKFIRLENHLLQLPKDVEYEDLAISQFGKLARRLRFDKLSDLKENVSVDKFIAAVKEQYGCEAFKEDFELSRKVLRTILNFLEIDQVAFYIDRYDNSCILLYDEVSEDKAMQLHRCIDKIYDRDSLLLKRSKLDNDEYQKYFDEICDPDTELLYINKNL